MRGVSIGAERGGTVSMAVCGSMRCDRVGLLRVGKIDRADGKHLGRMMMRRRAGYHDHGGDAAKARKRQAFDQFLIGHDFVRSSRKLAIDTLDPERMIERHRFPSRSRQDDLSAPARAPADLMGIEPLSRSFTGTCCKTPVRGSKHALHAARSERRSPCAFRAQIAMSFFRRRSAPGAPRSDRPDRCSPASTDGLARPGDRSALRLRR